MSNPLYQQYGRQAGGMSDIVRRFQQFKQMFNGDPRQQVQQMLNSGRISQAQYNSAVQMAQQLQKMING